MGSSKSKMPQNGNVENDLVIEQLQEARRAASQGDNKLVLNDANLFGLTSQQQESPLKKNKKKKNKKRRSLRSSLSFRSKKKSAEQTVVLQRKKSVSTSAENKTAAIVAIAIDAAVTETNNEQEKGKENEKENEAAKEKQAADEVNADQEDEKVASEPGLAKEKYAVDYSHVKCEVTEFIDKIKVTDKHAATNLLKLFDQMKLDESELKNWKGDYGTTLSTKADCTNKMKSVIEYAENNSQCTKAVKTKLRVVTKLIMEDNPKKNVSNYQGIFLLLASHGNVCNVMKNVAIEQSYHIMTGGLDDYVKSQTLQQQLLKVLRDLRVVLVENLFHSFKFTNNTHYIAGFHNTIAEKIGVVPYNDPNISYPSSSAHKEWKKDLDQRYFAEYYTMEKILSHINLMIESKKIGYQKVVAWFEEHCPQGMKKTDFLSQVIDIDTGRIRDHYMCYLLQQMGVFCVKGEDWKPIPKTWS